MLSVNFKGEQGSAAIEFIGFGLLLQIPLLLIALNLVSLQHDQLAAEAITRDALRSYVLLDAEPSESALRLAGDYRIAPSRMTVSMSCIPIDCLEEGAWVYVKTRIGMVTANGVLQR